MHAFVVDADLFVRFEIVPDEHLFAAANQRGPHFDRRQPAEIEVSDDVVVTDQCAHAQVPVGVVDVVETGDAVDVDEHLGEREPELHHRDEALPAGEHLRFVAELGEQRNSLVRAAGSVVLEGRRLHAPPR